MHLGKDHRRAINDTPWTESCRQEGSWKNTIWLNFKHKRNWKDPNIVTFLHSEVVPAPRSFCLPFFSCTMSFLRCGRQNCYFSFLLRGRFCAKELLREELFGCVKTCVHTVHASTTHLQNQPLSGTTLCCPWRDKKASFRFPLCIHRTQHCFLSTAVHLLPKIALFEKFKEYFAKYCNIRC